jgi:hypothetical protein
MWMICSLVISNIAAVLGLIHHPPTNARYRNGQMKQCYTNYWYRSVLRIRDVYPDHGSASKNLSILNPTKLFLSSRKYDPGCSSRILIFYPFWIPNPGVKKAPDQQHWYRYTKKQFLPLTGSSSKDRLLNRLLTPAVVVATPPSPV